jgi:WD40 repeat protein
MKIITKAVVAFPGGKVMSASCDSTIKTWDSAYYLTSTWSSTTAGCFNALKIVNTTHLAAAGENSYLSLFDMATGKVVMNLTGHTGAVTSLTYFISNSTLISGSNDQTVKFWNLADGLVTNSINVSSAVRSLKLFCTGTVLAVQCNSDLKIINMTTGSVTSIPYGTSVYALEALKNNSLATGSSDGLISTWTGFAATPLGTTNVSYYISYLSDLSNFRKLF